MLKNIIRLLKGKSVREIFFEDEETHKGGYLKEELGRVLKVRGKNVSVYINPTKKELGSAHAKDNFFKVRFMADNENKLIYIWPAGLAIHNDIKKEFNISKNILTGEFDDAGLVDFEVLGVINKYIVKKDSVKIIKKFKWIENYIFTIYDDIVDYIKDMEKRLL